MKREKIDDDVKKARLGWFAKSPEGKGRNKGTESESEGI